MMRKITGIISLICIFLFLLSACAGSAGGGGAVRNLNEIGFEHLGKYTQWVSVDTYDFSDGTASYSTTSGIYIYEINPNNHLISLYSSNSGKLEDKQYLDAFEYTVIDNDSVSCSGSVFMITDRNVSSSGKAIVIDADMPYEMLLRNQSLNSFVPSECIDWSRGVEIEEPTTAGGNTIRLYSAKTVFQFHLK